MKLKRWFARLLCVALGVTQARPAQSLETSQFGADARDKQRWRALFDSANGVMYIQATDGEGDGPEYHVRRAERLCAAKLERRIEVVRQRIREMIAQQGDGDVFRCTGAIASRCEVGIAGEWAATYQFHFNEHAQIEAIVLRNSANRSEQRFIAKKLQELKGGRCAATEGGNQ